MDRQRAIVATLGALAVVLSLAGCKSSAGGETTETGVLTGYEFGDTDEYWEQRRDRPDYRDFD